VTEKTIPVNEEQSIYFPEYLMRSGALEHGKEYTTDAMNRTSANGHLEIVKWLKSNTIPKRN